MEAMESCRIKAKHITRITFDDGTRQDFQTVRGSIVFPSDGVPGIILIAGQEQETGRVKILTEKEFLNTFKLPTDLSDLKEKYSFYCLFHGNDQADMVAYLIKKELLYIFYGFDPSEKFYIEIQMVNSYFHEDKLLIPRGGVLAAQLQSGWEHFQSSEQKLHGVLALFWLIHGFELGDVSFKRYGDGERGTDVMELRRNGGVE